MERVDYVDTFIAVAEDCPAKTGTVPPAKGDDPSVSARTYALIAGHPYEFTSGDVLFTVFADRQGIPDEDRVHARLEFFARSQPCLRSSQLGKRYGWGIHADARGRLALYAVDGPEYAEFTSGRRSADSGAPITLTRAMRNSRARP
ncbi:DUF6157 family protein [Saccharopolyspora gloriosae]|uniref:Uncharacterized protein n=1 Tax=Saccharopolyspora gloriosae TaxID=455344 RepID=A0A840NAK6_9PSEU|nr:DUF6157 family protein [Saccharopolyspora gloriosae]MBB5067403.1 hypothetical protein [Saccharopolyspora gloriosae]